MVGSPIVASDGLEKGTGPLKSQVQSPFRDRRLGWGLYGRGQNESRGAAFASGQEVAVDVAFWQRLGQEADDNAEHERTGEAVNEWVEAKQIKRREGLCHSPCLALLAHSEVTQQPQDRHTQEAAD